MGEFVCERWTDFSTWEEEASEDSLRFKVPAGRSVRVLCVPHSKHFQLKNFDSRVNVETFLVRFGRFKIKIKFHTRGILSLSIILANLSPAKFNARFAPRQWRTRILPRVPRVRS